MLTRGVHDAADDEAADRRAGKMQRRALLHAGVLDQLSLCQEVCWQLDGASEASSNHGGAYAAIQAEESLAAVDLSQAIPKIAIVVLGADRPNGRIALQTGLDQEKGTASSCADDTRRGTAEDIDGQVLRFLVAEEQVRHGLSHGLIEAKPASVEQDLVDVGGAKTAVYAPDAFILDDDADAVDRAPVVLRLGALGLQLALQLLSDLEDFGWMSDCDGSASCESACGETTGNGMSG